MNWNIRRTLLGLTALGLLVALLVGAIGLYNVHRSEHTEQNLVRQASALRNIMLADMMHDALRADVLRALFLAQRGPSPEREEVKAEAQKHAATFRTAIEHDSVKASSAQVLEAIQRMRPALDRYLASSTEMTALAAEDGNRAELRLPAFQSVFEELEEELGKLGTIAEAESARSVSEAERNNAQSRNIVILFVLGLGAIALQLERRIAGHLVGEVEVIRRVMTQVGDGDFRSTAVLASKTELGETANALNQVIEGLKTTLGAVQVDWREVGRERTEVGRIRQLIDNAPLNILYADRNLDVQYLNPAATKTLETLSRHLGLSAEGLLGRPLSTFYDDPSQPRRFLANPKFLPHRATFRIGPEHVELLACGILDKSGQMVGTMVTWEVISEKVEAASRLEAAQAKEALAEKEARRHELESERERQRVASAREAEQRANAELERQRTLELRAKVDQILAAVDCAAAGDLTCSIQVHGDDEIGKLGQGLARFFDNLRQSIGDVATTAETVRMAAVQVSHVGDEMGVTAAEAAAQSRSVGLAADGVSGGLLTITAATEEMSSSVKEIARSAQGAAEIATKAVGVAARTSQTVGKLGESSSAIGKVTKVIHAIAQQTNLLALNATIEAARAGDSGKGFGVVAGEVKELARETSKATEEIGRWVEAIQRDTSQTVDAIAEISEIISQISSAQLTIAGAVEEQTATTNEMSRNLNHAATSAREIASNVQSVAAAAQRTDNGARKSRSAASDLTQAAAALQALVARFKLVHGSTPPASLQRPIPPTSSAFASQLGSARLGDDLRTLPTNGMHMARHVDEMAGRY